MLGATELLSYSIYLWGGVGTVLFSAVKSCVVTTPFVISSGTYEDLYLSKNN